MTCGENDVVLQSRRRQRKRLKLQGGRGQVHRCRRSDVGLVHEDEAGTTELRTVYHEYDARVLKYGKQLATGAGSNLSPLVFIDTFQGMLVIGNANSLFRDVELRLSASGYAYWNIWAISFGYSLHVQA